MSMQAGSGRTYRYFNSTPVFPFGAGMSYTAFSLSMDGAAAGTREGSSIRSNDGATIAAGDSKTYTIKVANTGGIAGAASVLVYVSRKPESAWHGSVGNGAGVGGAQRMHDDPATPSIVPAKELVAFDGCTIVAGGSASLTFTIGPSELGLYNDAGTKAVYAGEYTVEFSGLGGSTLTADVTVTSTLTLETLPPVDNRPVH